MIKADNLDRADTYINFGVSDSNGIPSSSGCASQQDLRDAVFDTILDNPSCSTVQFEGVRSAVPSPAGAQSTPSL